MDEGVELLEAPISEAVTTPSSPEIEKENPMKTYIEGFQKSALYKEWFDEFYAGKTINPSVTEEMKKKVYEQHGMSKTALYEYSRIEPFHYAPEDYPQDVQDAVAEYLRVAKEWKRSILAPTSPGEHVELDKLRKSIHNTVGNLFLQNKYVRNSDQGAFMAHLISVDQGLDKLAPPLSAKQCAQVMANQSQAR